MSELASRIYGRGILPSGEDEEIDQFAQDSAVVLQQRRELRGPDFQIPDHLSQPWSCLSKPELTSAEYETLLF